MIGADGAQLGIMSARDALNLAAEKNLDLVKIAPQATPPVCKIIDYGKYRFEQAKREKEAKKNQRVVEIKEIRLSLNIDTHDFETKRNHAIRFLNDGNKVKVSSVSAAERWVIRTGCRHHEAFSAESLADTANVDKPAKFAGRNMLMFLAPKPVG